MPRKAPAPNRTYASQIYPGSIIPHPQGIQGNAPPALKVVHTDPKYFDGTSYVELRTYLVTEGRPRRGKPTTSRREVGSHPLMWVTIEGAGDHPLGTCEDCSARIEVSDA